MANQYGKNKLTGAKETKRDTHNCLSEMVAGYNDMYKDPLAYAKGTYESQIKSLGRRYGGTRDAIYKAQGPWDKNSIPQ